ncbi:hypothetical protein DFH06DRAFT_466594 [Mycena polygramma]|nr:hypothetical protein DFH06DRAFT_466594 [Mycena polygramma]
MLMPDPAELSEEIRLLASAPSASSTSRETLRLRISPEYYGIEVLPPDSQQHRNGAAGRHIRDSPEQRRSRFLDHIFPEIKDDIHPFSRCPTDTNFVAPTLDIDWDFTQDGSSSAVDSSAPSGEDLGASAEDSETVPGLGLTFPSISSVDDPNHEAEHPPSISPSSVESSLADVDLSAGDHPISAPDASASRNGENARNPAENSDNLPGLGLTLPSTSSVDDLSHDEAERPSSSPSSAGSSFDEVDLGSSSSPVTSISMPSTARPFSSSSNSTVRTDTFQRVRSVRCGESGFSSGRSLRRGTRYSDAI